MARGRAAAQAANRRLADAQERIAALEQRQAEQAAAHALEVKALRDRLQRAESDINRQVKAIAEARVAGARDDAAALIKEVRDTHLHRVISGLLTLQEHGVELNASWPEVAEAFGVQVGPMLAGMASAMNEPVSRHTARTTNSAARWKLDLRDQLAKGELHENKKFTQLDKSAQRAEFKA